MYKKIGCAILSFCFLLSSVNLSLATQMMDVPPIIVEPVDMGSVDQQMLEMDRQNQEKEVAIRGLIDQGQRLSQEVLEHKQIAALEKINNTLDNAQKTSKYYELIKLTEDVDSTRSFGETVELERDAIGDKYKVLTDLTDELKALNEKLGNEVANENIEKINRQQDDANQALAQRLGEMEQKITDYEESLAEKNQQIAQLNDDLAKLQSADASKDETIQNQKIQLDILEKGPSKFNVLYTPVGLELPPIIVKPSNDQQPEPPSGPDTTALAAKDEIIKQQENQIALLKSQAEQLSREQGQEESLKGQLPLQATDLKSTMEVLRSDLDLKSQQVELLKTELENKITELKAQGVLTGQIQDLKTQLQDKVDRIAAMKVRLQAGEKAQEEVDSLKKQLASQQDIVDELKQQLDNRIAESNKMSLMMDEYQKKLESKDSAYNSQMGQQLTSKNYQTLMEKEITDLNTRLQEKEAQIIKIKKNMYDLQELSNAKDKESQSKDLSLAILQQKIIDLKAQLASAQQFKGMSSSDELEYLKTGMQKATTELGQKDKIILQTQANADEYQKEFRKQSQDFQSLKDQLMQAEQEIKRKDENEKELQAQLKTANAEIQDLQDQLKQGKAPLGKDALEEKLKQALDKIDAQGKVISVLAQKLQDCGQSIDLTKNAGN